jgi:hypothetical protein
MLEEICMSWPMFPIVQIRKSCWQNYILSFKEEVQIDSHRLTDKNSEVEMQYCNKTKDFFSMTEEQ